MDGGQISDIKKLKSPREFLPKQKEVLDAINTHKFVLYSGAFGAGKTLLMCHVIIRACINNPKCLCLITSQTVAMLRDTVVRTFLEEVQLYQKEFNDAGIKVEIQKKWLPSIMSFKFFNGSEVLFRSCDDPMKFKSLNLDCFAIDEPVDIDENVFLMLQGRLRANHIKHRFGVMAGNPAGKSNWVYRYFFENSDPEYYKVHTRTYDNIFLPSDYIQSMRSSYDVDYARRYLDGEWGSFEGQVYKDFSMEKHVGEYKEHPCKYYIAGVDIGYRNPTCILTIGVDNDNNTYVVDEYYETEQTLDKTIEYIEMRNHKYQYHKIYVDPSAITWIERAKEKKLRAVQADNDIDNGVAKCKALFANDFIHIDKSCKNLVKEVESYQYDYDRLSSNLTEKPIKKNDHACYDKETEILTEEGWKLFKDLTKNEKVASMDEYGILEYQKPTDYIEKDYDDYIYKYNGKIDFAVTKDHDMLVVSQYDAKKIKKFNPQKISIENIYNDDIESYWIPKICGVETKNNETYKIDAYTLGFYLAEGCKSISRDRRYVHFDNTNIDYIVNIHNIYGGSISELEREGCKNIYRLSIRSDFLYDNLPFGLCDEKRIPRDFIENASYNEVYSCFIGMVDGDGSISKRGQTTYNSTSEKLIDDFQELLIKIGMSGTKYIIKEENKELNQKKCWRVIVYSDRTNYHQLLKKRIIKEKYNDKVYCVTVPNGNVCVRRNGRIMFCGNCDALRYAFSEFSPWKKYRLLIGGKLR